MMVWCVATVNAQTLPNLGTAATFGVLSGANFSASDTLTVKEKIGSVSGNLNIAKANVRVSGTGTVITTALANLSSAISTMTAQTGSALSNTLTSQTFTPGVYTITGNALITGNITLTGDTNSIYIFNVSGDAEFNATYINTHKNTILPSKVFWNISGKVKLKSFNYILGSIIAKKKIKTSSFETGDIALLSLDSIFIDNPNSSIHLKYKNYPRLFAQNNQNYNTFIAKVNTDCLSSIDNCNMITNPSFEDHVPSPWGSPSCPYAANDINFACDWYKYNQAGGPVCCVEPNFGAPMYGSGLGSSISWGTTADFFADCGSGEFYLPYNMFTAPTILSAHTGVNAAGICAQLESFYMYNDIDGDGQEEWQYFENLQDKPLKRKLPSTLIQNKVYYMEFYSRLAEISNKSAKIAVYPLKETGVGFEDPEYYNSPTPLFISSTTIPDNNQWNLVSGCFSTNKTNVDYFAIKTYIDPNLTDGGVVPATPADASIFSSYPITGNAQGTYWTAYFFLDDVVFRELANAGTDKAITCTSPTFIGENCSPITGAVYSWAPADAFTTANSTILNPSLIYTGVNFATVGTFVFNLTVTLNGCSSTDQVVVTVTNNQAATVTSSSPYICGNSISFNVTPSPSGTYTYNWYVTDATSGSVLSVPGTGFTTTSPTFNFTGINQNVNVCVTITNAFGCSYTKCTTVLACCTTAVNTTKYTNTTFNTNTTLTGSTTQKYHFGGTINVDAGTLEIIYADVTMDPFTKVVVKNGAKLKITESYVHGCNGMWNGIFAISGSTVQLAGNRIEDGIRTLLDSTGGATFTINGNIFNKNHVAITSKGAKPSTSSYYIHSNAFTCSAALPIPASSPYVTTTPNLANAYLLNSYSIANLLPPYQSQKSYEGMQFVTASQTGAANSMIPIGISTNGFENVFDKMQIGIHTVRSKVLVQNNVFQNIKNSINPSTYNAGVFVYSNPTTILPACNIQVGGSSLNEKNTFTDNDYGVYTWYHNTLNISNNVFSNQTTGIYIKDNKNSSVITIHKNKLTGCLKGVLCHNNTSVVATINENRFDNSAALVGNGTNNDAITLSANTVPAGNPTNYGNYTVYNNYINKYYNGIYCINTYNTQMTDNEIHMAPDNTTANFQMGIKVDGARYANANNNTIDMVAYNSSTWWWQFGVFYANAQAPFINCNNINNVGTSIKIQGPCNTLANTNEFVNNKMSNAYTGVWLDGSGDFNASQAFWNGGTAYAADNNWTGTMNQRTYSSSHSNLSNSILFTQIGTQFKVATTDATDDAVPLVNKLIGNNNSTPHASNTCATQISTPAFRMNSNANARLFAKSQQIAKNILVPNNSANATNLRHLNKRYLLENIQLEQADVSNDTVLSNFMGAIRNSNIGKLNEVDSLLHEADVNDDSLHTMANLAFVKNSFIQPQNMIEQNQKQFNRIYVDYLSGTLSNGQIVQLRKLAVKCPDTDGHAVFQARAVLAGIDHITYNSNCADDRKNARMDNGDEMSSIENRADIVVYPNPANTLLNAHLQMNEQQQASITIYNIIGELVKKQNLQNGTSKIDVSDLKSGTYLYRISIDDNEVKKDKLIIIK